MLFSWREGIPSSWASFDTDVILWKVRFQNKGGHFERSLIRNSLVFKTSFSTEVYHNNSIKGIRSEWYWINARIRFISIFLCHGGNRKTHFIRWRNYEPISEVNLSILFYDFRLIWRNGWEIPSQLSVFKFWRQVQINFLHLGSLQNECIFTR